MSERVEYEYASTYGAIDYDDYAAFIEHVDDPIVPDGEGWELVAASPTGHVKRSCMYIIWTWRRVKEDK